MTECNRCGACCDPVTLLVDRFEQARVPGMGARERRWLLEDLSPMPYREARRKAPHLTVALDVPGGLVDPVNPGLNTTAVAVGFYRCRHFDPATRTCASHDDLPQPCRDFPWFGLGPRRQAALPPPCSFRADIGQPITPIDEWLAAL